MGKSFNHLPSIGGNGWVAYTSGFGESGLGKVLYLSFDSVVFETYQPSKDGLSRGLESQSSIEIGWNNIVRYSGKALLKGRVFTGGTIIYEAKVEDGWAVEEDQELGLEYLPHVLERLPYECSQHIPKLSSKFKLLLSDISFYLQEFKHQMDRLTWSGALIEQSHKGKSPSETELISRLEPGFFSMLDRFFDRFDEEMSGIEVQKRVNHQNYAKAIVHPLLLCAPFVNRTYFKPLGYAGDYEMVNMIVRNGYEGNGLYAKLVNRWFLRQPPAEAHRNRIQYLTQRLIEKGVLHYHQKTPFRVLNIGCGPAAEVRNFLIQSAVSDFTSLTLFDFNSETLDHASFNLESARREASRRTLLKFEKCSVQQILRQSSKGHRAAPRSAYDFAYCAGLFDYLSDSVCEKVIEFLYHQLDPGGLLVVTNVDDCNPRKHTMEAILDWHLIYRDVGQIRRIIPAWIPEDEVIIHAEPLGVNVLVEIRKPVHEKSDSRK